MSSPMTVTKADILDFMRSGDFMNAMLKDEQFRDSFTSLSEKTLASVARHRLQCEFIEELERLLKMRDPQGCAATRRLIERAAPLVAKKCGSLTPGDKNAVAHAHIKSVRVAGWDVFAEVAIPTGGMVYDKCGVRRFGYGNYVHDNYGYIYDYEYYRFRISFHPTESNNCQIVEYYEAQHPYPRPSHVDIGSVSAPMTEFIEDPKTFLINEAYKLFEVTDEQKIKEREQLIAKFLKRAINTYGS